VEFKPIRFFSCTAPIFQKEGEMSELSRYDEYVSRAKLERTRYIGDTIANGLYAAWTGIKKLASVLTAPASPAAKRPSALGIPDPR
jgi:hypothetical protein